MISNFGRANCSAGAWPVGLCNWPTCDDPGRLPLDVVLAITGAENPFGPVNVVGAPFDAAVLVPAGGVC